MGRDRDHARDGRRRIRRFSRRLLQIKKRENEIKISDRVDRGLAVLVFFAGATLVNLTNQVTGTLPHGNGGTDVASPGSAGNGLRSGGTNWASSHLAFSDLSGSASAAQLPNPSSSTLGGIESHSLSITHEFLIAHLDGGVRHAAQPACGDLSDSGESATPMRQTPQTSGAARSRRHEFRRPSGRGRSLLRSAIRTPRAPSRQDRR